jgi:hypothetical protein
MNCDAPIVNRRHLYQALLDPGRVGKIDENRAFTVTPSVSSKSYSTRRRGIVGEISDRILLCFNGEPSARLRAGGPRRRQGSGR